MLVHGEESTTALISRVTNLSRTNSVIHLHDRLAIEVTNIPPTQFAAAKDAKRVALFLNDLPFNGLCSEAYEQVTGTNGAARFIFNLDRNSGTQTNWVKLLGSPKEMRRDVSVGVGFDQDPPLGNMVVQSFEVIPAGPLFFWSGMLVLFVYAFFSLSSRTELIRDSNPCPPTIPVSPHQISWGEIVTWGIIALTAWISRIVQKDWLFLLVVSTFAFCWAVRDLRQPRRPLRTYSLARTQMAIWFLLIAVSYVFLWQITGALDSLTPTVLALMGIGAGTALGAEAQDASKNTPLDDLLAEQTKLGCIAPASRTPEQNARLTALPNEINTEKGKPQPSSVNFFDDVLTDNKGISFHRFQMFIWTIILGLIFLVEVWRNLAMPDFNMTLLALMGISSGTYLGFMFTEPHSSTLTK